LLWNLQFGNDGSLARLSLHLHVANDGSPRPWKETPQMKRLALALATTAILGFAAPAFAADSDMTGTKSPSPAGQTSTPSAQSQTPSAQNQTPSAQTQTPSAQNQTPSMQKAKKSKASANATRSTRVGGNARMRRPTTLARHERGFQRGHYYAYAKPQHKPLRHKKTITQQ
jgi:hypothetical protein